LRITIASLRLAPNNSLKPTRLAGENVVVPCLLTYPRMKYRSLEQRTQYNSPSLPSNWPWTRLWLAGPSWSKPTRPALESSSQGR
jgi:hypothetical protein